MVKRDCVGYLLPLPNAFVKNANPVSTPRLGLVAALWVLSLAGCAQRPAPREAPAAAAASTYFTIGVDSHPLRVQLAVRDREMERGLMGRRDLGPDDAMLFVFRSPTTLNFWMRDTPSALDVGYFGADGILREVYPMFPFDERPVTSRSHELQFALEVNQGWFESHGVRGGARIDLRSVAAALKARGFDPVVYGLSPTP